MSENRKLEEILSLNPVIIGIGNTLRSDDGAGVELVQRLIAGGYRNALIVFSNPENYLRKIARMPGDARLWIDIINWNAIPGDFKIFDSNEIGQFAISTHNFSADVLVEFLTTMKNIPDYFLGIQPQNTALGEGFSKPVAAAIDRIYTLINSRRELSEREQR